MAQAQKIVKFKSSFIIIDGHKYEWSYRNNKLTAEQFSLLFQKKATNETIILQLSFKYIHKVKFFDNSEGKGAGFVLHINDFLASKIQHTLNEQGNDITNIENCPAFKNVIIFDLLNCDAESIMVIRQILKSCEELNRRNIIERCGKVEKNDPNLIKSFSTEYIGLIYFDEWKTILNSFFASNNNFEAQS